jgi:hypothetical protein
MSKPSNEQLVAVLNGCLRRLVHSAAQYVSEAYPYTASSDKAAITAVREIVSSDDQLAEECTRLIAETLGGIPRTGLPNPELAETNYLSFPYLLDVIAHEIESQELPHFEQAARSVTAPAKIVDFLNRAAAAKREHLEKIQGAKAGYAEA